MAVPMSEAGEKTKCMKNIILISMSFMFVFTAFQGLSRLQSSLHVDEGMGVICSSVLYGALVLSCLVTPHFLINLIGHKWTIPLSFCGYILWMAANGYGVWYTMVPASIIVGFAAAPLWTAQCSYFTIVASRYAKITGDDETAVVTRFFGIFFCFFQVASVTGSVISTTILKPDDTTAGNTSLDFCGINDCGNYNETELKKPDSETVWTMLGIYIGIAALAVLMVAVFVDPLDKELIAENQERQTEPLQLLISTVKHLRHKSQLLLIPITMYSGFEQSFYSAEFSKSFVACGFGIWQVGLVTIPFGIVNAIVSFSTGRLVEKTGRIPIFVFGFMVDVAIQCTLRFWVLDRDQEWVLFLMASMWGITDGIWQTQLNALVGSIFTNESEAAFANYRLFESLGFIIAFAYSQYLCTEIKLYILSGVLVLGFLGYIAAEILSKHTEKNTMQIASITGKDSSQEKYGAVNAGCQAETKDL